MRIKLFYHKKTNNLPNSHLDFPIVIALVLMLFGFCIVFLPFGVFDGIQIGKYQIEIGKYSDLGQFISGVTAPFFSGAAFILLYKTYSTQHEELKSNREFILKQVAFIDKQQFESVYFKMINMHQLLAQDVSFSYQGDLLKGKSCFLIINKIFENQKIIGIIKFDETHKLYNEPFDVYLNFFFQLLNYLKYSAYLKPSEMLFYLDVFIASLSKAEAKLISTYGQNIHEHNEKNKVFFEFDINAKLKNVTNN